MQLASNLAGRSGRGGRGVWVWERARARARARTRAVLRTGLFRSGSSSAKRHFYRRGPSPEYIRALCGRGLLSACCQNPSTVLCCAVLYQPPTEAVSERVGERVARKPSRITSDPPPRRIHRSLFLSFLLSSLSYLCLTRVTIPCTAVQ